MTLFDQFIRHGMPFVPKPIVGKVAQRYVAGEEVSDAMNAPSGNSTPRGPWPRWTCSERRSVNRARPRRPSNSISGFWRPSIARRSTPTSPSNRPCSASRSMRRCAVTTSGPSSSKAAEFDNFVRIDMEDHTCTDATLEIYRRLHRRGRPRRCRSPGLSPPDRRRHQRSAAAQTQYPAVQGDLPRAEDHRVEAVRDRSRQFHLHHGKAPRPAAPMSASPPTTPIWSGRG